MDTADLRARAAAARCGVARGRPRPACAANRSVLRAFAEALDFPSHFGANWDALADACKTLTGCRARAYVIHLRGADAAQRALGAQCDTLLEILREAAAYWKARGKPFVVLVDGVAGLPSWT